jgi:hypothetical protein
MAFEKTQNKLDELRNLTWQNGKLVEQIEKLTKMLEEKDDSTLVVEINEAKRVLADAINTKGGDSTSDESFQQLADDIKDLPIDGIFMNYGLTFSSEVELQNILLMSDAYTNIMNEVVEINDYKGYIYSTKQNFDYPKLKKATFAKLYDIKTGGGFVSPNLEELFVPNLENLSYYLIRNYNIRNIHIGTLNGMYNGGFSLFVVDKLRNITIGYNTDVSLLLQRWEAKEVILEGQSGIDELNNNLRTNLLEKLADHSTDGQTRTLRLGWLAHVTQENIDYANSKGWTLTT